MINAGQGKEAICGGCQPRICCYHYRVALTGFDLWQIAKTLELSPVRFATYVKSDADSEATFVLDQSGQRFELVLAKTADARRFGGCLFLVKTNDGTHRCGLGELRPDQCQLYPAYVEDGVVRLVHDPDGCWRRWSASELDLQREHERSQAYEARKREYQNVLAEWNQRVWRSGDRQFTFAQFCDYLENRYAAREAAA